MLIKIYLLSPSLMNNPQTLYNTQTVIIFQIVKSSKKWIHNI